MGAWVWFLIAVAAGIAGVALLLVDRAQTGSRNRERRRWAGLRGWQFADADAALPDRWRHGALASRADGGGAGTARNVVTGSLFTAAGRRLVHVFDHEHGATGPVAVIAAVQRRTPQPVVLELWLPTVKFSADGGLDLLGPVGDRYAFTSDVTKARPLITPELVELSDDAGDDVPVLWIEDTWVVASVGAGTGPSRLERLLRLLGELADLVDGVHSDDASRSGRPVVRDRPSSAGEVYDSASKDADGDAHDSASGSAPGSAPGNAPGNANGGASGSAPGSAPGGAGEDAGPDAHGGTRPGVRGGASEDAGDGPRDTRDQVYDHERDDPWDDAPPRGAGRLRDAPKDRPS